MHPGDDRAQRADLREEVDIEVLLPSVDAQLSRGDLASGLEDRRVKDDAVNMAEGLLRSGDCPLEPSSIGTGSNESSARLCALARGVVQACH